MAQYQYISRARTEDIVLNEWQKMIARYWIEVTHRSDMAAMAEVRWNEEIRCGKDDRLPFNEDAMVGFEFICMHMVGPDPQYSLWFVHRLGLLLCRFALAYKNRFSFRGFTEQLPGD